MLSFKEILLKTLIRINFFQNLACLYEATGAGKLALRSLEKAIAIDQDNTDLHLQASRIYLKLGQIDQAALHCKKAASGLGPGSFIYWLERSKNRGLKPNHWEQSEILELREELPAYYADPTEDQTSEFNNSGLYLLENGRYREALACFKQAMVLDGDSAILFNTGICLSKLNQHQEALAYYIEAQFKGINSPELLNNKGYSLFHLERYEEALACYEVARQYLPQDITLLSNLASCYRFMKRTSNAIDCYKSAIKAYPNDATLYNNLAICYEDIANPKEALENYEMALKFSPENCTFLLNYCVCLESLGHIQEALHTVMKILDLEPQNYRAWGLRADLLINQGKMKEAAACYEKAFGLAV
ncbi:tetratricopeptide repeat protein [Desulfotomaculum sp. 1211_IL3151]|uniref:tetratricopeptide repeat protein n=1 Tax=Desulfotomaculum sp. 1211_IL3151 TaxID=3084055 RepID=UPI002FD93CAD